MAISPELNMLHRVLDELRSAVRALGERYGDIPPVRRLRGDVERIDLDAADLDDVLPPATRPENTVSLALIEDTPTDPALFADADDEGLGGYHR